MTVSEIKMRYKELRRMAPSLRRLIFEEPTLDGNMPDSIPGIGWKTR
jgi:hypothetical protein